MVSVTETMTTEVPVRLVVLASSIPYTCRYKVQDTKCRVIGTRYKVRGKTYKVQGLRYKAQRTRNKVRGTRYEVRGTKYKAHRITKIRLLHLFSFPKLLFKFTEKYKQK